MKTEDVLLWLGVGAAVYFLFLKPETPPPAEITEGVPAGFMLMR